MEKLKYNEKLKNLNYRFSPKKQIKDLENKKFFSSIKREKELEREVYGKTNIFRIIKTGGEEDKISDFLGWLLNPSKRHGLEDKFLNMFLRKISEKSKQDFDVDSLNLDELQTKIRKSIFVNENEREPDMRIESEAGGYCCIIENKFGAEEGNEQLKDYREWAEDNFEIKHLVFLTINGRNPTSDPEGKDRWVTISHRPFILELLNNLFRKEAFTNSKVKKLFDSFRKYLELRSLEKRHHR